MTYLNTQSLLKALSMMIGCTALLTTPALASDGHETGGGGSRVIIANIPQIADPFVLPSGATGRMHLSSEMKTTLKVLFGILETYGVNSRALADFKAQALGYGIELYYAKTLPCSSKGISAPDLEMEDYGCTENGATYVLEKPFKELSHLDQALAILHERLHAYQPLTQHHYITDVVSGLKSIVLVGQTQSLERRQKVSEQDRQAIDRMLMALVKMDQMIPRRFYESIRIADGGGIVTTDSKIGDRVFVGVNSQVYSSEIASGVGIVNSVVQLSTIGENGSIQDSNLVRLSTGKNVRLADLTVQTRFETFCDVADGRGNCEFYGTDKNVIFVETSTQVKNGALILKGQTGRDLVRIMPKSGSLDLDYKKCTIQSSGWGRIWSGFSGSQADEDSDEFFESWCSPLSQ